MIEYYRSNNDNSVMPEKKQKLFFEYIDTIELVKFDNFILDKKSLNATTWKCEYKKCSYNKTNEYNGTCCDGGGIMSPKFARNILANIDRYYEYLGPKQLSFIEKHGIIQLPYKLYDFEDECILLGHKENERFCSLHKYAIEHNEEILLHKSFDCSIEPLEIIVIEGKTIFITISNNNTYRFCRWGNVIGCIDNISKCENLLIYQFESILAKEFGDEFIKHLKDAV